jgi:hypothetical protein
MGIDPADLNRLEEQRSLFDVVLHELGHALGFGTVPNWRPLLLNSGTSNPRFAGRQATAEYNSLGGSGNVPVEVEPPPRRSLAANPGAGADDAGAATATCTPCS